MLRNKRDYRSATKNREIVKELENKEKNVNQMETCQVEPLKKKDLMRYFKKVQKELRREVSSDNQDKKSSIVSEDSKNVIKKVLKNQEKPSNCKTKCFKVLKSSLLGRVKEKTKNVESPKSKHDTSDIYNDDASCSSYKKSTSDSTHLHTKRFSKNYLKSSNPIGKVPIKKQCCQYCQLSPKLQKAYSIKGNGKDTIKVHKHETNKNQSKEHFQSARTEDIRISGKQKSQRKILKLPVDTYSSSTKISVDSMSSSKTGKKNTLKLRHKYTQSIKSTTNKKISENQNIGNISSDQFQRNTTIFPIKDDLNSSEILHCEELLKQEKKYHPPDRPSCDDQLNVSNLKHQCKKKSQDFVRSSKSQNNLSSLESEKSPGYLRSRIDSPREFFLSKSTECDSLRSQILQLKKDVCRKEGKYRGRFWMDNGRTNILGNGGDVSYKNKAGRSCEKRGQEKLCKLVNTCRGREWLGCSCEGEEEEEMVDCFEYCRCPENVDNYDRSERRLQCQGSCKTAGAGQTMNFDTVTVKNTCSQGLQKCRYTERKKILEKNRRLESPEVSFRERDVGFVCKKPESQTNRKIVMARPLRKKNNAGSGQTCPQTFRRAERLGKDKMFTEFERECFNIDRNPVYLNSNSNQVQEKLTRHGKALNDITKRCEKSCQTAGMSKLPRESYKRIIKNYNPGKEFSFEVKASSTPVKSNLNIPSRNAARKAQRCNCKELFLNSTPSCQLKDCSCIKPSGKNEEYNSTITTKDFHSSTPYHSTLYNPDKTPVTKLSSNVEKTKHVNTQRPIDSSNFTSFSKRTNCQNCSYCYDDYEFHSEANAEKLWDSEVSVRRKWPTDPTNVRVMKPRDSYGETNLKKVLIYPPHGEPGPPLTLYKNASRVNCKVKGNACKGFSYNVTYIQKFVSPAWHPEKDTDSFFLGIPEKCDCSSGYG